MEKKKYEKIIISIILIIQTIIFIIVGANKSYIHMDEAYSLGLASYDKVEIQDNENFYNIWHDGKYYEDYLCVNDDEIGQYKQVYENQKNDVHPPLYYLILRFAMGFHKNSYSKWPGIIINMIIYAFVTIFMYLILNKILKDKYKYKEKSAIIAMVSSLVLASITNVIYIRMYALSTLNVLITTYLHLMLLEKKEIDYKLLIFIGISALAGSLTHYYYLFYLAMMFIMFAIKYIKEKLQIKANQIEDLTKIASNTLSEITHYTTVAIGPKVTKQIIKEIKFVLLGSRMLMAVILTNTGMIKETIINFGEDIYEDQIETINLLFNSKLQGKPLEKINEPLDEYIFTEMKSSASMIKTIIEQLNKVIYEESKLYLEGTNKSFDLPELSKTETARNFINILENKSEVVDLLDNEISKDINVYFGDELDDENLKDFSIVTLKSDEKDLGTIGIIGPKRMNYSKIISVMRYIQRLIDEGGK